MLLPLLVLLRLEHGVGQIVRGVQIAGDDHVAQNREVGEQADILERAADAQLRHPMGRAAGDIRAVEDDLAAVRRVNAGDVVEDGGLTGAIGADEAMNLSRLQHHAEIVDGADAAEVLLHILHFKDWCCHISGPPSQLSQPASGRSGVPAACGTS